MRCEEYLVASGSFTRTFGKCEVWFDERETEEVYLDDQMQVDERKETMKTGDGRRKAEGRIWEWLAALAGFLLGLLAVVNWL